jgi:CheY-like chemotaxis protein
VLGFFPVVSLEASSYDMPAPSVQPHKAPPVARNSAKGLALLAGRKLLLADDSVTIQKVIELTFADEGVRVIAFGNGDEALENLQEVAPDVVLADVFMPGKTGYQLCEHIKQNEQLKHIPVMLLVGSFEPFDEAEARRVGADDILTKPFQSIRRLIDRVGALVSSPPRPAEAEIPTAELPKPHENGEDQDRLNADELAISTADTMPLPEEWKETLEIAQPVTTKLEESQEPEERRETESAAVSEEEHMESSDVLLDLGDFEPVQAVAEDDFVLDLDMPGGSSLEDTLDVQTPAPMRAFVEPQLTETVAVSSFSYQPEVAAPSTSYVEPIAYEDQVHEIGRETQPISEPVKLDAEPAVSGLAPAIAAVVPGELSQEMIDAIARRAVEMLSDKVIREIAWEVVPDLAELLIKRQLEDKESQPR